MNRNQITKIMLQLLCAAGMIISSQTTSAYPQKIFIPGNKKIDGTLFVGNALIQRPCPPQESFPLGAVEKHLKTLTGNVVLRSTITGQQQIDVPITTFFDIPLFLSVTGKMREPACLITVENVSIGDDALAIEGYNDNGPLDNGIAAAQISIDIGYERSPFLCPPLVELNLQYGPQSPIDTFRTVLEAGANLAVWFNIETMTTEITKTKASIKLLVYVLLFTVTELTAAEVNNFNTFLNDIINRLSLSVVLTGTYEPGTRCKEPC